MGGDTDTQCVAAHLTLLCPNQHLVGVLSYWDEGVPTSWREHWVRVLLRRIEPSIRYAAVGQDDGLGCPIQLACDHPFRDNCAQCGVEIWESGSQLLVALGRLWADRSMDNDTYQLSTASG
jgi:hypothetical protein